MASFTDATPTAPRNWQDRRDFGRGNQIQELGGSRGGLAGLVGALRKGGLGGGGMSLPSGFGMRDTPPGGLPTQFDPGGRSGAQLRSDWAALDPAAQATATQQFRAASPEMQASVLAATGVDAQGRVLPTPGSYTGGGLKLGNRGASKAVNAARAAQQGQVPRAQPSYQDLMGQMGPAATADYSNTAAAGPALANTQAFAQDGGGPSSGPAYRPPTGATSDPTLSDGGGGNAYRPPGGGLMDGGGGGLQGLTAGPRRQPNRRPSSQDITSMYGYG